MNKKINCPICKEIIDIEKVDIHNCILGKDISQPIIKGYILELKHNKENLN